MRLMLQTLRRFVSRLRLTGNEGAVGVRLVVAKTQDETSKSEYRREQLRSG